MFDGTSRKRAVRLGGRSAQPLTRDGVLARARLEKQARHRDNVEREHAKRIQSIWRSSKARNSAKTAARISWQKSFGGYGESINESNLAAASAYLVSLCFFVDVSDVSDVEQLAVAARSIVEHHRLTGQLLEGAADATPACAAATAQRLMQLSLQALSYHRERFSATLAAQRQRLTADSCPAASLVELLLLLTDPKAWPLSTWLLRWPARRLALPRQLALLLQSTVAVPAGSFPAAPHAVSSAEALATTLTSRALSAAGSDAALYAPQLALLAVPLLWERVPTMRGVISPLVRLTSAVLAPSKPAEAVKMIPAAVGRDDVGARISCTAATLGNLLAAAPQVIQDPGAKGERLQPLLAALVTLMKALPLAALLSGSEQDSDEGSPDSSQARRHRDVEELQVPPGWHLDQSIVRQMTDSAVAPLLLRPLVHSILPAATAAASRALPPSAQPVPSSPQRSPPQAFGSRGGSRAAVVPAFGSRGVSTAGSPAVEISPAVGVSPAALPADTPITLLLQFLGQLVAIPALRQGALRVLALQVGLVERLWFSYLRPMQAAARQPLPPDINQWGPPLVLLAKTHLIVLLTADNARLDSSGAPLPALELYARGPPTAGLVPMLCCALWRVLWTDAAQYTGGLGGANVSPELQQMREDVGTTCALLARQLFDRNAEREFAPLEAFQGNLPERFLSDMQTAAVGQDGPLQSANPRVASILSKAPFLVSFMERAKVFQTLVAAARKEDGMMQWGYDRGALVTVQRGRLLADGYQALGRLAPEQLRRRVQVQFVDEHDMVEAGIDGGGLFKEFLEQLVKEAFNPNAGLFAETDDKKLYPHPQAASIVEDAYHLFNFLGKMLGKAMFEGILLELPLAGFFLKQLRGAVRCDVNDLPMLDQELYSRLMWLRDYSGDASELSLTFTVRGGTVGEDVEKELVPGGSQLAVTNANKLEYIHRFADYRLNRQLAEQTAAFRAGLSAVVAPTWTAMFAASELQTLISGVGGEQLDISDLAANTKYAGGYNESDAVIVNFWTALKSFTPEQHRAFLRFVTSVSRPPLLGFRYLEPPLCIQKAGGAAETARLPTAATCMNLLKLPPYKQLKVMREKLLCSIMSGSGFGLS